MDDSAIEERIAEIKGTAVHNCLAGGRSFPSYLQWNLLGPLMIEYEICLRHEVDGSWVCTHNKILNKWLSKDKCPKRAILLAIIEANNE